MKKVNLTKVTTTGSEMINNFMRKNVVTQCPDTPAGTTQRIRIRGAKPGASRNKPVGH